MTERIVTAIYEHKLIAIVRGVEPDRCMQVAQALYDGGIRLMEITYDQQKPESWEKTAQTIGAIAKAFEGRMFVGAGTVTSPELVELTACYGGQFVLSPDTDEAVIRRTRERGLVSIPGALTPTEILRAYKAGAHIVKIFPAGLFGLEYLRAIQAPISHVPMMVVYKMQQANVAQYLRSGAVAAGIGGSLVNPAWVEAGELERITQAAREFVAAIKEI